MGRPIKKGSTDQSTVIRIIDSTDGTPENAVEHDTSGIDLWWRREKETKTSITEAALASLDAAHGDGGIELIGDGYYRLDLPDAAAAAGSGENSVQIGGTITGMIVIGNEHALVDYDPYDAVRAGLTALPNANADAASGLPISDAGGLDLDAKLANTNEVTAVRMGALTDWINNGRLDTLLDAIKAKTDNLPADPADDSDIDSQLATIAGYLNTEIAAILAAVDTEVAAIKAKTDNLPADPADDSDIDAQLAAIAGYLDTEIAAIVAKLPTNYIMGSSDQADHDAAGATAQQIWEYATRVLTDKTIEGSVTDADILRLTLAILTGLTSGGGTNQLTFRDLADSKDRLVVTVDDNGNRTVIITLDGT